MENYMTMVDCQCHIWGRCYYVCRAKMGTKTRSLLEISWYHRMYNVVNGVSHKSRSLQLSSAVSDANLLFLLILSVLAVKSFAFLILSFHHVQCVICFLLGNSPASWLMNQDAGELPKRKYITYWTWRKLKIKKYISVLQYWGGSCTSAGGYQGCSCNSPSLPTALFTCTNIQMQGTIIPMLSIIISYCRLTNSLWNTTWRGRCGLLIVILDVIMKRQIPNPPVYRFIRSVMKYYWILILCFHAS